MCDEIDVAQERMEIEMQRAIDAAKKSGRMPETGFCYNCKEPTAKHFCDGDCRTDWEKRERMVGMRFDSARYSVGDEQ